MKLLTVMLQNYYRQLPLGLFFLLSVFHHNGHVRAWGSGRPLRQFKVKSSMQSLLTDTAPLHFVPQQGDPPWHIVSFSVFITAPLHQKVNFLSLRISHPKLTTLVFFVWLHFFRWFESWSSNTVLYYQKPKKRKHFPRHSWIATIP